MKLRASREDLILYWIFFLLPLADLFTGALLSWNLFSEGGLASPSQAFRMALLVVAFWQLKAVQVAYVSSLIFVCLISEYIGMLTHQSVYGFGIGVVNVFKIVYVCCLSLVISNLVFEKKISKTQLLELALNGLLIYSFNVVLAAVFGFGEKTYGDGTFGTKGFVPSNNGLSLTLGAALILSLHFKSRLSHVLRSWVIFVAVVLIGAKASIVFVSAFSLVVFIRAKVSLKIVGLVFVVSVIGYFFEELAGAFAVVFDVIVWRYQNSSDGIVSFLASGRDAYVKFAFSGIGMNLSDMFRLIFGQGALVSFHDLETMKPLHFSGSNLTKYETLESDLFDVLFQYGSVLVMGYLLIMIGVSVRFLWMRQWLFLVAWLLICMFSILAGHTIFNGMSATLIILLVAISSPVKSDHPKLNQKLMEFV